MAKYNIMILERIAKDNLIVEANRIVKQQPPTGGSDGHGDGEVKPPKAPTTKDMLKEILATLRDHGNRLDGIEQRLDKQDVFNQTVLTRIEKLESREFNSLSESPSFLK